MYVRGSQKYYFNGYCDRRYFSDWTKRPMPERTMSTPPRKKKDKVCARDSSKIECKGNNYGNTGK